MAKLMLVLFALCAVPSIVTASFEIHGQAYLDTCLAGFYTSASSSLADASVKIQCTARNNTSLITYSQLTKTDSSGKYLAIVEHDQGENLCHAMLDSSSHPMCAEKNTGVDRSVVILTANNGIATNIRNPNDLSCTAHTPLTNCAQVMEQYVDNEADD